MLPGTPSRTGKNNLSQVVSTDAGAKALGLRWDTQTDVLCFDPSYLIEAAKQKPKARTKSDMLKLSSRIFYPFDTSRTTHFLRRFRKSVWRCSVQQEPKSQRQLYRQPSAQQNEGNPDA